MTNTPSERSLGELFAELSKDTSTLVRKEVQLAKTEVSEKLTEVGKNVAFLVVGGAVAYAALLFILAAVAVGLTDIMTPWLAVLIVGLVVGLVALVLVQKGLSALRQTSLTPEKTVETLKENKEWIQKQVK